jgi:hypothetical protein
MKIHTIITHPGGGHRDDFMACCILLAAAMSYERLPVIKRREPTQEELDDPEVAVVDIGGEWASHKCNFDHHQLPKCDPYCAASMVLDALGIHDCRELLVWVTPTEIADHQGPDALADHLEIPRENLHMARSPVESAMVKMFEKNDVLEYPGALWTVMRSIGEHYLVYIRRLRERLALLSKADHRKVGGLAVMDTREIVPGFDDPAMGIELFCERSGYDPVVTISNSDRTTDHVVLHRRHYPHRVNFRRLRGLDEVPFVHGNGHMCVLAPEANVDELLAKAIE